MKARILGWMINEKVNHDSSMVKNHGLGLSCGILIKEGVPSLSSLKG